MAICSANINFMNLHYDEIYYKNETVWNLQVILNKNKCLIYIKTYMLSRIY